MQNDIDPKATDLAAAIKEKVGEAYYKSFIDFQTLEFLAPFAVDQEKLAIIMRPEVISTGASIVPGKELSFKAIVTLKPSYEVTSYDPVKITAPKVKVTEEEIDQQLLNMAEQFVTYETDEPHPIQEGEEVSIGLDSKDSTGEPFANLTFPRRNYPVGQGYMPPEFDAEILGMQPGETKTIELTIPGLKSSDPEKPTDEDKLTVTVTINENLKRIVPAITDAWVKKNMPIAATVPELREKIRAEGTAQREQERQSMLAFLAASEFSKRFDGKIPDEFYEFTRDDLMATLQQNVRAQGKTMEEFMATQAGGEQQFGMQMMLQTREVLVQGFSLDALARHLKLELEPADIEQAFHLMAPGHEKEARLEFEHTGRMYLVREGALRNKANQWLIDTAEIEYVD